MLLLLRFHRMLRLSTCNICPFRAFVFFLLNVMYFSSFFTDPFEMSMSILSNDLRTQFLGEFLL